MKVTFLGTGTSQGIPIIGCECAVCLSPDIRDKRLRVSVLLQINNKNIVIDTGPDFRQQMLRTGVKDLHAILMTHEHNDHVIGIDDVRPLYFRLGEPFPVYATKQVQTALKQRFDYIFQDHPYPGVPRLSLQTINASTPFSVAGLDIIPVEVMHAKLPVLGFRIGNFAYITDAKTISDKELDKIRGLDILVLNALHRTEHYSHLSLSQALEIIKEIKPKQAYLTHIGHKMGLHNEVSKELPDNVALAYDQLSLTIK